MAALAACGIALVASCGNGSGRDARADTDESGAGIAEATQVGETEAAKPADEEVLSFGMALDWETAYWDDAPPALKSAISGSPGSPPRVFVAGGAAHFAYARLESDGRLSRLEGATRSRAVEGRGEYSPFDEWSYRWRDGGEVVTATRGVVELWFEAGGATYGVRQESRRFGYGGEHAVRWLCVVRDGKLVAEAPLFGADGADFEFRDPLRFGCDDPASPSIVYAYSLAAAGRFESEGACGTDLVAIDVRGAVPVTLHSWWIEKVAMFGEARGLPFLSGGVRAGIMLDGETDESGSAPFLSLVVEKADIASGKGVRVFSVPVGRIRLAPGARVFASPGGTGARALEAGSAFEFVWSESVLVEAGKRLVWLLEIALPDGSSAWTDGEGFVID